MAVIQASKIDKTKKEPPSFDPSLLMKPIALPRTNSSKTKQVNTNTENLSKGIQKRNSAEAMASIEPEKRYQVHPIKELEELYPEAAKIAKQYEQIGAFINKTGDRMILNLTGDDLRKNLFERGFIASISNAFRSMFGYERTDDGLKHYKELFYNDLNHSGESPDTLISNLSHSKTKFGGHYYGQVIFKKENGKFIPEMVFLTDSAYFAAKDLKEDKVIPENADISHFKKAYILKYMIPLNADHKNFSMSDRINEVIDCLMANKPEMFDTFAFAGSPDDSKLKAHHSFAKLNWKFPIVDNDGKWSHIDGHLDIIQHVKDPIKEFHKYTAEVMAKMQTAYGEQRHPDKLFVEKCRKNNQDSIDLWTIQNTMLKKAA